MAAISPNAGKKYYHTFGIELSNVLRSNQGIISVLLTESEEQKRFYYAHGILCMHGVFTFMRASTIITKISIDS